MSESTLFARLFAGFLLGVTGVYASCPMELNPPSVVVKYGDPVSINCSTSVPGRMGWEATLGGTGIKHAQHLTWSVENLTDWTVSLQCFFNPLPNTPYKQCFKTPKLVLYTFPETIVIRSSSGSDGVMEEMKEYTFTCDIYNVAPVQNLTVLWYKEDTLIFTDTFKNPERKPVNQSSVFTYTPKRNDNGATFRCEAHLDLGPEGPQFNIFSEKYNITVHFGPELQCSSPELAEGETLEKHCPVTGNPTPLVRWLKDGQLMDPAMPLRRENAGVYTVEAEGSSSIKKDLQVLVLYGPELRCPSTYTSLEYAPHNFTCRVEGYPQPEITWHKDGEEVELLEKLTRSDAGQYTITASNRLSNVSVSVEITVTYPPSQIVELEDSEVDVGSTVWLKCSSMGNPRPKYSWNYYRTANVEEENDDGVSRLHIYNATAYNMGSYTCHASNDKGNVSKTVRVTVKGVKQKCPVEISPSTMVIQYGDPNQKATCAPSSGSLRNQEGEIYWQAQGAIRTTNASWWVDTTKDWDPRPVCTATFSGIGTCQKTLNFILYKMPDSVFIRSEDDINSLVEEKELQLQCDITNVAPAQNLVVLWYQGNKKLEPSTKGPLRVTGCLSENSENCSISVVRSPVNVTSSINITVNRTHNGAEFTCKAQLDLGSSGPKLLTNMTSDPLNITVFYKPIINTTKLPKTVPVFRGYPTELICEADGNPPPKIQWFYSPDKVPHLAENILTVSEAGFYNCTAANQVESVSYQVEVILKEDYLPLIAGFVAVTVVAISVIFLFIYSIYYKNTKMRRYSLKNPKLSSHNGNVAHNGWDLQFPMTKLS